jgi:hypothetical protein
VLRDLIKVIQQESYGYSDPITQVRRRWGLSEWNFGTGVMR